MPSAEPGAYYIERVAALQIRPSPLRPPCHADRRIFQWKGTNTPSLTVLAIPILAHLLDLATASSLDDTASYGAGLRKFHIFCDTFSVTEAARLPAAFPLLHSFMLWAVTDPDPKDPAFADGTAFETVSIPTIRKYLSAIRAWHLAQGWPPPLSDTDREQLEFSLRGMAKMQGASWCRPLRPPITIVMMRALKASLDMADSFEACIWAMATCAFFGLMRFGEVSVPSRAAFSKEKHLTRGSCLLATDLDGRPYARLHLPAAKTAAPGECQDIFFVEEQGLCPLKALQHLAASTPAGENDPLFSWRDKQGTIQPMLKVAAMNKINSVLSNLGWGNSFGHSFRIGSASFYMAKGVETKVIRIHG